MADSPELDASGPVVLTIRSDGATIPDSYEVIAVRTRAETNRIPEAVIVLNDGDAASQDFPATDAAHFRPGAMIEIAARWGDKPDAMLFSGRVTAVRARLQQGRLRLEATCRDEAFKLTMARRNQVFRDVKDSDLIARLASDAGLETDVQATSETHPLLVQARCTDWDFLLARAEAAGLAVGLVGGKLTARRPDAGKAAALTVTLGVDLIDCDLTLSAREQYAAFETAAWDPKTLEVVSANEQAVSAAQAGDLSARKLAATGGDAVQTTAASAAYSASALGVVAKARRDRAELARLRGGVTFRGSERAKLGAVLEIKGLASRFAGKAVIAAVSHRIEDGDWLTEAGLGQPAPWRTEDGVGAGSPPASGLVPAVRGLQIGLVEKVSEDKDGLERIKVRLPTLAGDESVEARYGAPYASKDAGLMLLPEVGDEVVVAFLDDDPAHPVVLASLHSGKRHRPHAAQDEQNDTKLFRSRADLRLTFDEKAKSIALSTPGAASVIISDEEKSIKMTDHAGNTVTLSQRGVSIESKSDLTLSASAGVTIKAGADVKISGANVEISGDVGAKLKGGASAEVSAGGQTKVAGAMVMIN